MILSHTRKRLMAILLALTLLMTLYAPTALAYDTSKPEELTDSRSYGRQRDTHRRPYRARTVFQGFDHAPLSRLHHQNNDADARA